MHAILPAGGRGTRMVSITGGAPKEALPLGESTVLGSVAEECRAAGLPIRLVWSEAKGEPPEIDAAARIEQPEPLGLGDAVRRALEERDEALVVALPDVVFPHGGPLPGLVAALDAGADFAVAVESVPEERVSRYGIVEIAGDEDWRIERMIEKPASGETASRWAVASRYALGARAIERLRTWSDAGEFGLTEVLQAVLDDDGIGLAVPLEPDRPRFDCGSPDGYAAARDALAETGSRL